MRAVEGSSVRRVLGSVLSSYYAIRSAPADVERFREQLSPGEDALVRDTVTRLECELGVHAAGVHRLALSDRLLDRVAEDLSHDSAAISEWAAFEMGAARLAIASARMTRALRRRKQVGDFIPAADGLDAQPTPVPDALEQDAERADNRALMALEILSGERYPRSTPIRVLVDVTNRCNFRCRTCYQSSSQDFAFYDLDGATFERLAPFLRAAAVVCFAGTGEPLLSPDTPAAIRFARLLGAEVELVTNGSMLERLASVESDVSRLFVSFDGATEGTLGMLRKGADFERITRGITALPPAVRRRVVLNMVVCRANVGEIASMARLAKRLGVGALHLQAFHPYLPWHDELALQEDDQAALSAQVALARKEIRGSGLSLGLMLPVREADAGNAAPPVAEEPARPPARLMVVPESLPPEPTSTEPPAFELARSAGLTWPRSVISAIEHAGEPAAGSGSPDVPESDRRAHVRRLLPLVQAKGVSVPHCIAPYALLYLQGDGTTRPCCVIESRAADIASDDLREVWHAPAYVALREALHSGVDLPPQCHGCTDGTRFAMLGELLEEARLLGVNLASLGLPEDPGVPDHVRNLVDTLRKRTIAGSEPLRGHLDYVLDRQLIGWAFHPDVPMNAEPVDVEIDGVWFVRVYAEKFRDDLLAAGIGDGHHGFVAYLPENLADGTEHVITARFAGTERQLVGSPMRIRIA